MDCKPLREMSSAVYKPLNDTDTDEELKTLKGKLNELKLVFQFRSECRGRTS